MYIDFSSYDPESAHTPDVNYARDLQAQGACALRFFKAQVEKTFVKTKRL